MNTDDEDPGLDALLDTPPAPGGNGAGIIDPALFREAANIDANLRRTDHYAPDEEPPPLEVLVPDDVGDLIPPDEVPLRFVRFDHLDEDPPPDAGILHRPDGRGLFYAGAVNSIAGDPGAGKTFAALLTVVAAIAEGRQALLLDYEDTPGRLRSRLVALGVTPTQLSLVHGIENLDRLWDTHVDQLIAYALDHDVTVIVIDSVTEALEAHGLDENSGGDLSRWNRRVPQRLARDTGAAVILIDHRAKPPSSARQGQPRGLWQVGSRHKLAAVDGVAYVLEAREPFSRATPGRTGRLDLIIAKDRHGAIGARGDTVARFELTPDTLGAIAHAVTMPPGAPTDEDGGRLTPLDRLLVRRDEILPLLKAATDQDGALSTRRIAGYLRTLPTTALDGPKLSVSDTVLRDALFRWRDLGLLTLDEGAGLGNYWRVTGATAPAAAELDLELDLEPPDNGIDYDEAF